MISGLGSCVGKERFNNNPFFLALAPRSVPFSTSYRHFNLGFVIHARGIWRTFGALCTCALGLRLCGTTGFTFFHLVKLLRYVLMTPQTISNFEFRNTSFHQRWESRSEYFPLSYYGMTTYSGDRQYVIAVSRHIRITHDCFLYLRRCEYSYLWSDDFYSL